MALWDDVKTNLAEWYTVTSEKTSELARISTRRYDKFGISREIERQFSELGNFVYSGIKEGKEEFLADPAVQGLIARIQELETELREKDREIDEIKAAYGRKKEASEQAAADEGDDAGQGAAATVITDPVLHEGNDASAILVEPAIDPEENPENPEP